MADVRFWPGLGHVQSVGPGVYQDASGHLHIAVPDLLKLAELPDTPTNRRRVSRWAVRSLASLSAEGQPA
jgi:hypothetical protein